MERTCKICGRPAHVTVDDGKGTNIYACSYVHLVATYGESWTEIFISVPA